MQVQLLEQELPLWPEQLSKELFSLREGVCDGRSEARLPTSPEMRAQYGNEACTCSMSLLCASSRCERCGASWRECRCVARVKNIATVRVRALKFHKRHVLMTHKDDPTTASIWQLPGRRRRKATEKVQPGTHTAGLVANALRQRIVRSVKGTLWP